MATPLNVSEIAHSLVIIVGIVHVFVSWVGFYYFVFRKEK